MNHQITKLLVKKILENPGGYSWSLQGLGMLRMYLSAEVRLHVWDGRFRIANVSTIHDHPWDFESYIVAGVVRQRRYTEARPGVSPGLRAHLNMPMPTAYNVSVLHCGPGNCERTPPAAILLHEGPVETYTEGGVYRQRSSEIHDSMPEDGTVTLVTRHFTRADRDHARVFWPACTDWVSAEPRPATDAEVHAITSHALEKWFPMNAGA